MYVWNTYITLCAKYFVFNYKMKQIFISYHGSKYNLYSLMFIVYNLCEHFPDDINLTIHKHNFPNYC